MKIINDKAKHEYEIMDRLEVGIVLTGGEAKAASLGQVEIQNAFVKILNTKSEILNHESKIRSSRKQIQNPKFQREFWVVNMHIYPYKFADPKTFEPKRTRKLLLSRKEMLAIESRMKTGRLTIVPTAIYTKRGLVKLEIGLARGKRQYEKREIIKKRDTQREVERELRGKE